MIASASTAYYPLQDVLVIAIIGGGAFDGALRLVGWLINRGKDKAVHDERDKKVDELLKKVTPNGRDSMEIGDISARSEEKIDKLTRSFESFRTSVNRRLKALETK